MEIKVGFEISYAAVQPTPMVIMLSRSIRRAFPTSSAPSRSSPSPTCRSASTSTASAMSAAASTAPAGGVTLRGDALVRDSGLPDVVMPTAQQLPIDQLPDEVLLYLMGSRYCETDQLTDIAWSLFGNTPPGWARVQAIVDFVHNHVTFGYQHAPITRSRRMDGYAATRRRLPRLCAPGDHLLPLHEHPGALLHRLSRRHRRARRSRADGFLRLVRGLSRAASWYTFDARHNDPRIGRILMGTGRDAADVALTTSFGRMDLVKFLGDQRRGRAGLGGRHRRHCERSEAIHSSACRAMDCIAALAMT